MRFVHRHRDSLPKTTSPQFVEALECRALLSAAAVHAAAIAGHGGGAGAAIVASPSAGTTTLSKQDQKYIQSESVDNNSEIALGNLALTTSTNADVIALANRIITDHTAAQQQLQTIAGADGVTLATTDRSHSAAAARLGKLTGRKFDIAFASFEVSEHKKGIKSNQREASKSTNSDVQAYAAAQVPVLQQHLALAQTALTSSKAESKTA